MFHVGQKVVCVNDRNLRVRRDLYSSLPKQGQIYTVRAITPPDAVTPNTPGVLLEEIKGEYSSSGYEYGFLAFRFRPIQERKTDISIFKAMLTPKKVRVEA